MIERIPDNSVRVKVTNDCQWSCDFCHNEGTELPSSQTKRVSVFLDESAKFLPEVGAMIPNDEIFERLDLLRKMGLEEVHLTGGEPTLNVDLSEVVKGFVSRGFKVKMTTNGQAQPNMTRRLVDAGISGMTFSILSFDVDEFLATQNIKSAPWAKAMIAREKDNILLAKSLGIDVKINTVVLGEFDHARVDKVREFAQEHGIKLILLPSLGKGSSSKDAVLEYAQRHAVLTGETQFTNSSKGSRHFILPDGTPMDAKYIRLYQPDVVCRGCEHKGKDSCVEGFYGIRVELREGEPYARLCVQKSNEMTVMRLDSFWEKDLIGSL